MRAGRKAAGEALKAKGSDVDELEEWSRRERLQRRPSGLTLAISPREEELDPNDHMWKYIYKGREFLFTYNALGCIHPTNPLREFCIRIMSDPIFDNTILLLIALNSVVMAMTDYSKINAEGDPVVEGSWANGIVHSTELFFTVAFTVEFVIKVVAMGFGFEGEKTYIRDPWNCLDFLVVVTGWVSMLPNIPNMTAIRTFRVLRPLKSVAALPGVQAIITAMLDAIPELLSVMVLLAFVFAIFGILGLQFFLGATHSRCRLTPHPVLTTWTTSADYTADVNGHAAKRCLINGKAVPNFDTQAEDKTHHAWPVDFQGGMIAYKDDSPWSTAQTDCYWPLDPDDTDVCTHGGGAHKCPAGKWCGSNWDAFGNRRFAINGHLDIYGGTHASGRLFTGGGSKSMREDQYTLSAEFIGDLNYGYIDFDSFDRAFVAIFQTITLEGWTDIMYYLMNAVGTFTAFFFVILVLFGSFFVLNLLLAVLESNYNEQEEKMKEEEEARKAEKAKVKAELKATRKAEKVARITKAKAAKLAKKMASSKVAPLAADVEAGEGGGSTDNAENGSATAAAEAQAEAEAEAEAEIAAEVENEKERTGKLHAFVTHPYFGTFITLMILLNTLVLALDKHPMDQAFADNLEIFNFIFTVIFVGEMVIKIPGIGIRAYSRDAFNLFDATIVIISLVELVILPPSFIKEQTGSGAGGGISALRSFRLFRVFKLAQQWKSMKKLLDLIVKTVFDMANFGILLFLFIYIYALLGMQFFANRLKFDDEDYPIPLLTPEWHAAVSPRANFDNLWWAVITIFQVLTGENWNAVMYDGMRGGGQTIGLVYFLSLVIIGMFIVMNLFMAILLSNFDELSEPDEGEAEGPGDDIGIESLVKVAPLPSNDPFDDEDPVMQMLRRNKKTKKKAWSSNPVVVWANAVVHQKPFENTVLFLIGVSSITLAIDNPLTDPESDVAYALLYLDYVMTSMFTVEMMLKFIGLGLWGKSPEAYFKSAWNILDFLIVAVSWVSLLTSGNTSFKSLKALRALRALRPLRMINKMPGLQIVVNSMFASIPDVANVATVCMLFFLIFSILAVNYLKGVLKHCAGDDYDALSEDKKAFLGSPKLWSQLTATEQGWFDTPTSTGGCTDRYGVAISGNLPCCHTWNSHIAVAGASAPITSKIICKCWQTSTTPLNLAWERVVSQHFDNVWSALGTFYEISTTEGWVDVMYAAIDATGVDMQPVLNHGQYTWGLFFVLFMVIGCFLMTNLFVGVIIENFNRLKTEKETELAGDLMQSEAQRAWGLTQKMLLQMISMEVYRPSKPKGAIRIKCFNFCQHPRFEAFIMSCIIANTIVMASQSFGQPDAYTIFSEWANYVFAAIFTLEAIIKITGLGKRYFYQHIGKRLVFNNWNIFDFTVVLGTLVGILVMAITGSKAGTVATVIRTFRIGRILRLINGAENIKKMFDALITTLPGLTNVGMLLALMFFIYSVVGVQLFATVAYNGDFNASADFRSFGSAFLTLLRFSTGENWNGYMHAGSVHVAGCVADPDYDPTYCGFNGVEGASACIPLNGCGKFAIYPYLMTFTLLITFIFLNLFIGIILDGFGQADQQSSASFISEDEFSKIRLHWLKFDPEETYWIKVDQIKDFIQTLHIPWGFGLDYEASEAELIGRCRDMHMHISDGRVHFFDILKGMSRRRLRGKEDGEETMTEIDLVTEEEDQEIVLKHAKREGIIDIHEHLSKVTETEEVSHILARLQLQRALKKHKFARMFALTDATKGQGKGGEGASGGGAGDGSGADGGAADTPGGAPVTTLADDVNEVGGGSEVGTGEGRTTGHEGEGRRTGLAAVSGADNAADGGGGGGGSGGGRGVDGGEGGDGGGGGSGGDGGGGGSCGRIELHHQSPAEPEPEPEPPV